MIEPNGQFEIDTEMMDSEIQLFSKKSSIAPNDVYRQGWILEEALKEEFTAQYNNQPSRLLDKMAHTDAQKQKHMMGSAYIDFNKRQSTTPWTDGKRNEYPAPIVAKTPVRNLNKPVKGVEVSNFSALETRINWQAKNQQSVSKWLRTRSNQKVNFFIL